ncbi:hypothetical protein KA005_45855, partial [bacterium]|nr:hypothetical protein [bacterium]
LRLLMNEVFGEENFIESVCVVSNWKGRSDDKYIATAHEHVLIYKQPNFETHGVPIPEEYIKEYDKTTPEGEKYRLQGLRKRGAGARREDRPNMFYPFYWNEHNKTLSLERQNDDDIEIIPKLSDGHDGRWRWGKETVIKRMDELCVEKVVGRNEYDVFQKDFLIRDGVIRSVKPKSFWLDKTFSSDSGTKHYKDIMGDVEYPNPKSPEFVKYCIGQALDKNQTVIDFFAGSGTTVQALMNLNAEDNGTRKYIMVEMGDYFDYVLMPRIKKLMFSKEWKDGKPISNEGHSHMFKYMYLEQYEDTLYNIAFRAKDKTFQETLETFDDYFVRYMLEYETRESATRLATADFENPFDYKIKKVSGSSWEIEPVDLVETFNYLLGLDVEQIKTAKDGERYYRCVKGRKQNGNTTVIVWRSTKNIDLKKDKEFIEEKFLSEETPDLIYVNGMCHVENAKPIEPEFKRLMGG